MGNPSQTPPFNDGAPEFPGFSTQMTIGGMTAANEDTPNSEESTPKSRKNPLPAWNTEQNLVLISGWIKFGTNSIVGKNQKGETYWGKIAEYCNEYCSFDPPRDASACRNRFNYMNKIISKWVGGYDNAKRLKGSGWSDNDVLAKAQEIYAGGKNIQFNLMAEWDALREQPRYSSQVGGNNGSESSGSKRSRDSDACGSNTIGSSGRPMGREAAKKKGKKKSKEAALENFDNEMSSFKQFKEKELERLDKIRETQDKLRETQQEANHLKKMEMYLKLSSEEHLNDRKKEMLKKLEEELFDN
ncbi:hypothetical protein QL285_066818 [Trifolium repens]|nr:hypothetical protein QL285_066818 [Trifolium repens]